MSDVKPSHGDDHDIEVAEVTEILETGSEESDTVAISAEAGAAVLSAESFASSCSSDRITSQRDVIQLLSEFGKTNVVRPNSNRSYAKRKALKRLMHVYTMNKLRPIRPTKTCKKYLLFRLPYRNAQISFGETKIKYLNKRTKASVREEPQPDSSALPISFDDYLKQMDAYYSLFLDAASPPETQSATESDLDVSDVKRYKSHLLSTINSQIIDIILTTKTQAEDIRCNISHAEHGKDDEYLVELDGNTDHTFRVGVKVRVSVAGKEMFGDITSCSRWTKKMQLSVKLRQQGVLNQECNDVVCDVRPIGLVGHLLLQAKALLALEQFPLHADFLDPVMRSLSSGIELDFPERFRSRYPAQRSFFIDSVQKIVDTVALNQDDVSRICVVDDYDITTLTEIFIDSVKYLIREEKKIIDQLRAVTEIPDNIAEDDMQSLKLVIVSKSKIVREDVVSLMDKTENYSVQTDTSEIAKVLKIIVDKSDATSDHKRIYDLITLSSGDPTECQSKEYDAAMRTARDLFLHSCRYVVGTIDELLNDEFICRMLQKKSRTFDVALVHDASSFSDAELISLLLFGVSKLICFTVTAKQQGNTIADRMVKKASESNEVNSKSPVLDRSVYKLQEENERKANLDRQRTSNMHAHSYRNNADAIRFSSSDVRDRESHQNQAERTHPRPQLFQPRGRGYDNNARSRGYDHNARGRGNDASRGARGRGGGAYQSLHYPQNSHPGGNRFQ